MPLKKLKFEASAPSTLDKYLIMDKIGQGTYGSVYRAENRETGKIVALKECCITKEADLHLTSFREIYTLKMMAHENVVKLLEVIFLSGNLSEKHRTFLVLEYIEHDLGGLLDRKIQFTESQIKQLMVQLLSAVKHIHQNWLIHRDLKLSNLLYSKFGYLKVTDFGLARKLGTPWEEESHPLTPTVQTLWYRAPELLLGASTYDFSIDLFSVGCIFGELILGNPILPGSSEVDQLVKTGRLLGSPDDSLWPGFSKMKHAQIVAYMNPVGKLRKVFHSLDSSGMRLMEALLSWNPKSRPSAEEALKFSYFYESPLPQSPSLMPSFPNESIRRKEKR